MCQCGFERLQDGGMGEGKGKWMIFKLFIEFVTILSLFYVSLSWPCGMWALYLPNQGSNLFPCNGR